MKRLALFLVLFCASPSLGADRPTPAVRITAKSGNCQGGACIQSFGSGCAIGYRGDELIVVTAGHVVRDAVGSPSVMLDKWRTARVLKIAYGQNQDYAILAVKGPRDWPCSPLGEEAETNVYAAWGYADGGPLKGVKATSATVDGNNIWWTGKPTEGMSGGPVVTRTGACVAVISGYGSDGRGVGTSCVVIRRGLLNCLGGMPVVVNVNNRPPSAGAVANPPSQPPVAPAPVPPKNDPPQVVANPPFDPTEILKRLDALEARPQVGPTDIADLKDAIAKIPPPAAPGPAGVSAADFAAFKADWTKQVNDLKILIAKNAPTPITVQLKSPDGTIRSKTFAPGEALRLRLPEVVPSADPDPVSPVATFPDVPSSPADNSNPK